MRLVNLIFLCFVISTTLFAQQDPEAKKILEQFTKKTKSLSAYKVDFMILSENHQNGEKSETKGNITIKGDKYKMDLNKVEVYFDGKDVYNFTPESNEVSIVKPDKKKDDMILNNPSKIFNLYTKDYKFQLLWETTENGHTCYQIDLYPNELNKKYSIIKLLIDKELLELRSAKLIMKSGIHYTLSVINFNSKINSKDSDFTFDTKAHKDIEVVDMR